MNTSIHPRQRAIVAGLAIAAVGLLAAGANLVRADTPAGTSPGAPAGAPAVTIDNFSFGPDDLTVPVGTTVVWTNHDDIPHTVTSNAVPRAFRSKPLDTGDSFQATFDKAGVYRYFCSLHPKMQGRVIVK
jgi:plastocyanin